MGTMTSDNRGDLATGDQRLSERTTEERCGVCRFWQEWDRDADDHSRAWGICRRYPPAQNFLDDENGMEMGEWRLTWNFQWCGEWKQNG